MIINKLKAVVDIIAPPTGYKGLFFRSDTGLPAVIDANGVVSDLVIPGDASGVTYTPADSLNWTDSVDPGNVDDALNDLAARTSALEDEAAPDAAQVTYTPQTSLHWTDSEDPGNVDDALDDLASRVQALEESGGAGLVDGDYGDITVSGSGTVMNIDAGVVGPAELANTAVSPGSYTLASITVDQQGRLTAASNGIVDASAVTFTPTNSIHWTDSEDPGDVDDALNDLASRVQSLEENGGGGGSGDVVGPASSTDNNVALFDGATGKLIKDSGSAFSTLYRSGGTDVALADGGTGASLTDPNADRIMFWDDSAGAVTWLEVSTGLSISGTQLTATGGSLTNWTEEVNTSAPNATVPVASFTATNAAATVDAALIPKAGGSLLAAKPNSLSTGGNKRGSYAVDWQTSRSAAAEVASGTQSVVSGGHRNTASGQYATAGGGTTNTASNTAATVSGGESNTASQNRATVVGGASNTSSGQSSTVVGGFQNTADGDYSVSMGRGARTRGSYGVLAHSSGAVGGGDDQRREFMLYKGTTNATPIAMSADNAAAAAANTIVLPNNSLFAFQGHLVVRENATGDSKAIEFKGAIKRGANAAATAILGTVTQADLGADAGASAWTVAFTAETTLGGLKIEVTGEASHTLRWTASVRTTEVVG